MSVTSNDRFKSTAGDGVTVDFDIDFPFASTSEVIVATVIAGVRTVLASGYTIAATAKTYASDATYPGGTITFTTAPAVGTTVQRYGETASTQAVTIPSDATLFSSGVQNIVDKLTRLYQEAKRELGFTVQVTPGTAQVTIPPLTDGPGYIYTDGTNPYEIVDAVDASTLTVGGDTTGYVPFWSGTLSLTGLVNFFYTTATKTLRLRGSTTVTDHTLKLQNSAGTDVATFRSDGVPTATTDLVQKTYVDTAISTAAALKASLTGAAFTGPVTTTVTGGGTPATFTQDTLGNTVTKEATPVPGFSTVQRTTKHGRVATASTSTVPVFSEGVTTDSAMMIDVTVIARRSTDGDVGVYRAVWALKNAAGTVTVDGAVSPLLDTIGATVDIAFAANAYAINVTPSSNAAQTFHAIVDTYGPVVN